MNTIQLEILGETYKFDPSKDSILKRGLIDPYLLSKNENEWVVIREYIFWSSRLQSPIVVPRWFITDLASIPPAFRGLISVNERHRLASLPHDVGYRMISHKNTTITRKKWDLVLRDFCRQQGVSWFKARMMYFAVRLGGWTITKIEKQPMYIPDEHKRFYMDRYGYLGLTIEDGEIIKL